MRVLLALVRRGSLKAAAAQLGVNISTASRRLDALEESVGQLLFDRTPDGTHPTAAAEMMVPFAEDMERSMIGLSRSLEGLEAEPAGVVRITAPPGLVDHFLAPLLTDLLSTYPQIRIEVVASIGYADLTRREADIALRALRPTGGDLIATKVGTAGYAVLASPKLAKRLGTLEELHQANWITYGEELEHLPEVAWVTEQVEVGHLVFRTNSLTAQLAAVRAGMGVKLESRPFLTLPGVSELQLSARLRKQLKPTPTSSLWLVGHRALRNIPRIAAVWDFLLGRFRTLVAQAPS